MRWFWLIAVVAACSGKPGKQVCADPQPVKQVALRIGACDLPMRSWRFARTPQSGGTPEQKLARAADGLVARELLAQAAIESGIAPPTDAEVEARVQKGEIWILGNDIKGSALVFEDGVFSYARLRAFTASIGVDVEGFIVEQGREQLAQAMRAKVDDTWLAAHCKPDEIVLAPALLVRTDDSGKDIPIAYTPCADF